MQAISPEQSNFPQAAMVSAATFAALALLGVVLAYWTWNWFAPRPEPRVLETVQTGVRAGGPTQIANGLFGNARRNEKGAVQTGIAIRLLGVVAASGGMSAFALMQLDAREMVVVRVGDVVSPGIRLAEVHEDRVILDRVGIRETLALPDRSPLAGPAGPVIAK